MTWLDEFCAALDDEFADAPRVAAMATIDDHGHPRVRSVICRNVEPGGVLWICSDRRSAKNAHLRRNPAAELAFWLPTRREQYRVAGSVTILDADSGDPRRPSLWAALSEPSRALFLGPSPGDPVHQEPQSPPYPDAEPSVRPMPVNFEILLLSPSRVEHLDLKPQPHRRRCWDADLSWNENVIHP